MADGHGGDAGDGRPGAETAAMDPAEPAALAAGWEPVVDRGFIALVGPIYRRPSEGLWAFRAAEKHANLIRVVHGGMLMSFADRALGVTAREAADEADCVTVQMDMQFVGVARMGDWVEARPEVVRRTNSLVFLRTDLMEGERMIASAAGVWKILRRREG